MKIGEGVLACVNYRLFCNAALDIAGNQNHSFSAIELLYNSKFGQYFSLFTLMYFQILFNPSNGAVWLGFIHYLC